jgi:HNH endonuclease
VDVVDLVHEKPCKTCRVVKPLTDYYKDSYGGYAYADCKRCHIDKRKPYNDAHKSQRLDASQKARAGDAFVEIIDRRAVYGMAEGHCKSCKTFVPFEDMTIDHVIPLSRGGKHQYNNVQMLCLHCNVTKGSKIGR